MMTPAVDSRRNIPALRPATIAENHIRWPTVFGGLAIHSVAMNSALIADIKTRSGVVIEVTTASSKRCDIVSEGYKLAMNDLSYERDRPRCVAGILGLQQPRPKNRVGKRPWCVSFI